MEKLGLTELYNYIEGMGLAKDIPLEEFKTLFKRAMKDLSDIENEEEMKVSPNQVPTYLFEILYQKGITLKIDWKWVPEDLLEGIKIFVPSLEYKITDGHFDDVNKLWHVIFKINGVGVDALVPQENPYELMERLNPFVEAKIGRTFVEFDDGTDSYTFILIPKNLLNPVSPR